MNKPRASKLPKLLLTVASVFVLVLVIVSAVGYFAVYQPAVKLKKSLAKVETTARDSEAFVRAQDLAGLKNQMDKIKSDLDLAQADLKALAWTSAIPFAGNYYRDGQAAFSAGYELIDAGKLAITAIEPYADVIGLKGITGGGDGGKTAQDRINFVVNTIDKLQPELEKIGSKLASARSKVDTVNPSRYPEYFQGQPIRSQIVQGIALIDQASTVVNDARPMLESAPYILGINSPRKYLLIFQNDAELRPTGGFMTGYAVISVSKGKISTLESDDIYKLDERFKKRIPAPDPIKKYMPLVPYWYLRDQNLSPDFSVSMDTFAPNYKLTGSPDVDGIIAVNTKVLVDLLKVTGPIGVPGYGNFSAADDPRCNCPQVFYELQLLAGGEEAVVWDSVSGKIVKAPANYGQRKAFLGPLMYSVLANVMAQPKSKMGDLFSTGLKAISGKHVLMYFFDDKAQAAAESFNAAGRVRQSEGDYLLVVDTNFSGAKTNIWVTYKAEQKTDISSDGTVTNTLTLTYSNPEVKAVKISEGRNLNGMFRNWHRVYVPKGSELLEASGYESGQTTGEDLDKTVFQGFFTLAPGNSKKITLKYKLPVKLKSPYRVLVQKQGGTKDFPYTFTVNNRKQAEVILDTDRDLTYTY